MATRFWETPNMAPGAPFPAGNRAARAFASRHTSFAEKRNGIRGSRAEVLARADFGAPSKSRG